MRCLLALLLICSSAVARDLGQFADSPPEQRQWFNSLTRPDMRPREMGCCSEADCRAVEARLTPRGTWEAKIDDEWVAVPSEKVEVDPKILRANPVRRPVACTIGFGRGLTWFCFEPWEEMG